MRLRICCHDASYFMSYAQRFDVYRDYLIRSARHSGRYAKPGIALPASSSRWPAVVDLLMIRVIDGGALLMRDAMSVSVLSYIIERSSLAITYDYRISSNGIYLIRHACQRSFPQFAIVIDGYIDYLSLMLFAQSWRHGTISPVEQ